MNKHKDISKRGIKKLRVIPLVLMMLTLTGCGFKMGAIHLDTTDTLRGVSEQIVLERTHYIEDARDFLKGRGIAIALEGDEEALDLNAIDFDNIYADGAGIAELSNISRSILMTTGEGRGSVTGKFEIIIDDDNLGGTYHPSYEFFYGDAKLKDKDGNTITWSDGSTVKYEGKWILYMNFTSINTKIKPSMMRDDALKLSSSQWSGIGTADDYPGLYLKYSDDDGYIYDRDTGFYILWDTDKYRWKLTADEAPAANPIDDRYSAFGAGSVTTFSDAYSGGNNDKLFQSFFAMSGATSVMAPSNYTLEQSTNSQNYLWEKFSSGGYIRSGVLTDIGSADLFAWNGVTASTPSAGYEVLSSSVVDYGRIYVLSPTASATEISEIQKKLYNFFGGDDENSRVITSASTSDLTVDGGAIIKNFEPTSICVVPPGFGILSYSMIPREGLVTSNLSDVKTGVVVPVKSGDTVAVGLGFIGPNPRVLDAMETVLGTSSGGFAIINQHIYLMAYPVSTVNYLYTNEEGKRAYIGLGAAPVYYNLIYDRLDYKFGDEYQFQTDASTGVNDTLYADYNFVGGIAVKDSTGVSSGSGGVCILQDEAGHSSTCRVQIAARENITEAKTMFSEMVSDYYVRNVPLWDNDTEDGESDNDAIELSGVPVTDYLQGSDPALEIINGNSYFKSDISTYLDAWESSLETSSLIVPQFVLMDYVESTLLPDAAGEGDAVVTGRKIRLLPSAMKYDSENHLYYFEGTTGTKIGNYVTIDGSQIIDDIFLGDIVDVRALNGIGYSSQTDEDWKGVQPPYGYNMMFPIGIKVSDFASNYQDDMFGLRNDNQDVGQGLIDWMRDYASPGGAFTTFTPNNFASMSYWDGRAGSLTDSTYYQTVSAVNNTGVLTLAVADEDGNEMDATSVVAALNVQGAENKAHLGVTDVNLETRIDELPYVPTNIITFSEPFPNTMFSEADADKVYTVTESQEGAAIPNVMYTVGVGTGIQHGNFYHAWVTSEAPTDSLTWWNNYLQKHNFEYRINPQVVQQYLETNYSYLANGDNRLRFDVNAAQYWSEELDVLNPHRGGNRTVNMIKTASNVIGWAIIFYAIACILLWAVDIYGGLDKDFYRLATGGRYVASAEPMPPTTNTHYATFLNALARSVILCVAGSVLIFVGASVILAKMFKFLALLLRLVSGYWTGYGR